MRALVLEGGSMRACYANGVLAAFEEQGAPRFDAVYGTSAGGALAAWYAARQARFCLGTWRYAQDRRILSWRRFLSGGYLLDHDALFRIVYETEAPLDVDAVRRAPFPVVVTATDADSGETVYRDLRDGPVLPWLRATGRLPLGTGPPVQIDGRRFVDGGVTDPVPLARAIEDGAREVVVVFNRVETAREAEPRWASEVVARRYPALRGALLVRHEVYNRTQQLAANPPSGVRVRVVRPARDPGLGRFTRDLAALDRAMARGRDDGRAFLRALAATA